jgi:phospholipase/lecithinase/hemolysin
MSQYKIAKRLLVAALTLASATAALAGDYSKLVVFGDSMSDTHRFFDYTTKNWGESDPGPPSYDGRFSDGPVAVEYLAQDLKIPLLNYAFAGATSGYDTLLLNTEGMLTQVNEYLTNPDVVPSVATVSDFVVKPARPRADPNALHLIWTGPDDFYRLLIGMTNLTGYSVVANIKQAVDSLYAAGARQFFIPTMPDLSMTPSAKAHAKLQIGYLAASRTCTDSFHDLLVKALPEMRAKYPDAKIMSHDTLVLMRAEFAKGVAQGKNITGTCRQEGVFQPLRLATAPATACPNPQDYAFWDSNHPTSWVNKILGDAWFQAISAQR